LRKDHKFTNYSQALIESKRNPSHSHILDAMMSIIFFGIPHGGLRIYDLQEMVDAESGGYETSRINLLKLLREGAEFLEVQKEELINIREEYKTKIISFYETISTPIVQKVRLRLIFAMIINTV